MMHLNILFNLMNNIKWFRAYIDKLIMNNFSNLLEKVSKIIIWEKYLIKNIDFALILFRSFDQDFVFDGYLDNHTSHNYKVLLLLLLSQ
jgi:hypothetical protein